MSNKKSNKLKKEVSDLKDELERKDRTIISLRGEVRMLITEAENAKDVLSPTPSFLKTQAH